MTVNDKILSRVKKLLNLANDAGATEGERDNAMRMAYATLAKYNLDIAMVEGDPRSADEERTRHGDTYHGVVWARAISMDIAELFFCKYFFSRISSNTDNCRHYFIGRQSNCMTAAYVARFVVESVHKEAKAKFKGQHYSVYRAFGVGAANVIHARCKTLRAEQERATAQEAAKAAGVSAPTTGTALVLASFYKQEESANTEFLNADLKKTGTNLKKSSGGHKIHDVSAYRQGREYGNTVSLSPQVGGSTQRQIK